MGRKKFLIVGAGGREAAFATKLIEDVQLYAVIQHENPQIVDCVEMSGGAYRVGDAGDPEVVLEFANKHRVDYAFVNADQPLANGVVDVLLEGGIKTIGGTREAARIEWDKVYSIQMMQKTCPQFTPFHRIVSSADEIDSAISEFESRGMNVVVKPQGLTGGKGVKVMPEHLETYSDCIEYASSVIRSRGEKVLLVEKLEGIEFTIMGITDGQNLVLAPASYDYPFRHKDDTGAGTGGMGCFAGPETRLPFMSDDDLDDCRSVMQRIIDEMRQEGSRFNGVLNGGFFKTCKGIKFMEFNSRFGDPEGLNVLSVLEGSFSDLLVRLWNRTLSEDAVSFARKASVTKYLVAGEYPDESERATGFVLDETAAEKCGARLFFASCVRTGKHRYETLKKSRVVAFGAVADTVEEASFIVDATIDAHFEGKLEYRRDIGSKRSLEKLKNRLPR